MSDLTNEYRKSIRSAQVAADIAAFNEGLEEETPAAAAPPEAKKEDSGGFMSDIGAFLKEVPEQLVGGIYDAANNTIELARDMGKAAGVQNMALQYKNQKGDWDFKFLSEQEVEAAGGLDKILPEFDKASTSGGEMLRALSTFATGFIPAAKGIKAAGVGVAAVRGMAAGGIADAVVTDPHQARLATMLNEVPALGAIIPDYLADNNPENEGEWEGRIKNVIEGAVLGGISEVAMAGVVKMFKGYKVAAVAKKAAPAEALSPEAAVKQIDEVAEHTASAQEAFAAQEGSLSEAAKKADDFFKDSQAVKAKAEGKVFINMDKINSEADVKKLLQEQADLNASTINAGSKTHAGIQAASESEMKSVNDLLGRPTTRPFTAEEAVAARDMLTTSADNLTELSARAADVTSTPEALFEFRKALALHNDIQTKVFGGRKATAQSLGAWKIESKSSAGRAKAIRELLKEGATKDSKEMAQSIADIAANGGNVSEAAGKLMSNKWADAHYQVWINGLLSSPATHGANAISNMGTTLMSIPERYITAGFEKMMGANGSAFIEANARAAGLMDGLKDGFSLMTGKTQNVALTRSSKFERAVEPISAMAWGKQPDSIMGKGLDYIGKAVGLPGWALEKGDNFFKGINYRMRLNEQASKQAFEEGLEGTAFKTRVADLVGNPSEAMQDVSTDFARYQTFTNDAGEFTKAVQSGIAATPGGKYVMPFVRTPSNIISYGFERTPLAPLMSSVRNDIKAGGSKAAEAMAKMAGGSMLMAGVAPLALNGNVTGAGPSNWDERRALEETGWQPYSIKAGDKYISYERLEPIGSLIAYSADITSIMGQVDDQGGDELVAASLAAFAKNLGNKTFLSGMTQFIDVMNSGNPKKIEKWAMKMGAGLIAPTGSSLVKKANNYFDNTKRDYTPDDVNGFLKSTFMLAQENIPGLGTSAPPLRDVWGETQRYTNGVATPLDALSPIKISTDKHDPVSDMIANNRIPLALPERRINGVQLTNKEYSRYSEIAGKIAKKELDQAESSGWLSGLSGGPDGELALVVKQVISAARKEARGEMMMDSPGLEDRVWESKLEKESKLLGE